MMTLVVGILLIIFIPVLFLDVLLHAGPPSVSARKVAFGICAGLSVTAGVLWLLGLDALPIVILAFVPYYQLELQAWVARQFRNKHGREMTLIANEIVTDPDRKKDMRYSQLYLFGAIGLPLLLLGALS
jgi:hypothetical protein